MNKRDLFKMYLSEDLQRAEDNYKRWQESYSFYLSTDKKVSQMLLTYYKRETEVAYELWQYKLKCYNRQLQSK